MASNGYPQQAESTQSYAQNAPTAATAASPASTATAPAATTSTAQSPDQIGWFFVESYYTNLNQNPDQVGVSNINTLPVLSHRYPRLTSTSCSTTSALL